MANFSPYYFIIDALLFAYACYSWYWQARLDLRGKFRFSIFVWTLLIIWVGFSWNYFEKGDLGINVFLALLLLVSIVDGFTGFAPKRAVVSGYFKRTIRYSEIKNVMLISVPTGRQPSVICIIRTGKRRQYYLRFPGTISQVITALRRHLHHRIKVEIKNIM